MIKEMQKKIEMVKKKNNKRMEMKKKITRNGEEEEVNMKKI